MSGPGKVPHWPGIARELAASGYELTEYGHSLAARTREELVANCDVPRDSMDYDRAVEALRDYDEGQHRAQPETPAQHIRNALAILYTQPQDAADGVHLDAQTLGAVYARLWKAARQLETA